MSQSGKPTLSLSRFGAFTTYERERDEEEMNGKDSEHKGMKKRDGVDGRKSNIDGDVESNIGSEIAILTENKLIPKKQTENRSGRCGP